MWHWKHLRWKICAISFLKRMLVVIGLCGYAAVGRRMAAASTNEAATMAQVMVRLRIG